MILRILGFLFRKRKSPYQNGYEYAQVRLILSQGGDRGELEALSLGTFNHRDSEHEFDRGIRDAIRDYSAQQKAIVENMIKQARR